MIENVWIYVYLWSIWDNVLTLMVFAINIGVLYHLLAMMDGYIDYANLLYHKDYLYFKTLIFLIILAVFLPNKNSILLIISANPVVKAVVESHKDGKLKELTDLALDEAITIIKDK